MTTQQDERAELIRDLEAMAVNARGVNFEEHPCWKAAALLEADAKGGEAVAHILQSNLDKLQRKECMVPVFSLPYRTPHERSVPLYTRPQQQAVAQGWKPIETAPKDGTMFLCWVKAERYSSPDGECSSYAHDTSQMDFCWWRDGLDGNGYFDPACGQIGDSQDVILWAPLPAVPGCASPAAPAAAQVAQGETPNDFDQELTQALEERDAAEDMADQLAAQIAAITGEEIGEHSSANNPWRNAMLAADEWIAKDIRRLCRDPESAAMLSASTAAPAAAPKPSPAQDGWQPIETAPKDGRTMLLGYPNRLGKWRTVCGQWMSEGYIAEYWEYPENGEPGWFETCEEGEEAPNCWAINPTHWRPLPGGPLSASPAAPAAAQVAQPLSDVEISHLRDFKGDGFLASVYKAGVKDAERHHGIGKDQG